MTKQVRRAAGGNNGYGDYMYGSAAPKIDIRRRIEEETPVRRTSQITRKNREKQHAWSPTYVVVLTACMVLVGFVLIWYINMQSTVVGQVATINKLETQLNKLRQDNDEEWSRINNSIDLEEIKRIAITELGMTYAEQGQIVTYTSESADYMRKVVED